MGVVIALCILNFINFVFGCYPIINHDQSQYCSAQYVFTGVVRSSRETDSEAVFQIQLTSTIKGRIGFPGSMTTVYGRGKLNSCGPTRLNRNQEYILYTSTYDPSTNRPEIFVQHDPNFTNLNRIKRYDCSCEIEIDLPRQPFPNSMTPAEDKCVITEREYNCNFFKGYCGRRNGIYGSQVCQWIAPNNVCPP
ncbi:uncharacterized protein LOC125654103 [Ostrea edulis]|uniref:uncharacterized protein LOC125654103 n=1 Tax=Ostrea edulis TaxID=37623 RepID=UPI0024AF0915|nr:uncharacterized protein LOC125654103 [Ostrea edulis]